jgi:hypothetical protein
MVRLYHEVTKDSQRRILFLTWPIIRDEFFRRMRPSQFLGDVSEWRINVKVWIPPSPDSCMKHPGDKLSVTLDLDKGKPNHFTCAHRHSTNGTKA